MSIALFLGERNVFLKNTVKIFGDTTCAESKGGVSFDIIG